MTSKRMWLLLGLVILVCAAGFFALSRWTDLLPGVARPTTSADSTTKNAADKVAAERNKAIAEARQRDWQKVWEQLPEEIKKPRMLTLDDLVTSAERFPLPETAGLLTEPPPLPEKLAPLLFIAPLRNLKDARTTAVEAIEFFLATHLTAASPGKVLLDLPPRHFLAQACEVPTGQGKWTDRTPAEYFEIARNFGTDIFVYGRADVTDGQMTIQLGLSDLNVTRTDTFSVQLPLSKIGDAIGQAVVKIAQFSGVSQAEIEAAGMLQGLPGPASFDAFVSEQVATPELFRKYFATEPDSLGLHVYAPLMLSSPEGIEFANESLKRWPNDTRLIRIKHAALRNSGNPIATALFASELIRRHGLTTAWAADLQSDIYAMYQFDFPNTSATAHALRKGLEDYLRLRPRAWQMRRLYGVHLLTMAHFDPASFSVDVSDTETIRLAQSRPYELALDQLTQAATGHMAPLALLKDILRVKVGKGDPPESLMPILARMQLIDPKNIEGDLIVAAYVGARAPAGDMAYLDIIKKAVERVGTSPQVMDEVTYAMVGPLSMTIQPSNSKNYMRLRDRPDALYYGEAMEVALSDGRLVAQEQMRIFFYVIKANNGWVPKWKIYRQYLDRNLKQLKEAMDAGRWPDGLKISTAIGHLGGDNSKMSVDYARVKCLWKLKRYRDALYYCERFQNHYPDKHTFYYMFAVIAEDAGVRLEEAYEKAKIAVPLDPTNQGIKDVLARLGQRLGKPTTL